MAARGRPSLAQVLHLLNANEIEGKLHDAAGRPAQYAADKRSEEEKVEEVYLLAYSRPPTEAERKDVLAFLARTKDKKRAYQDLLWALLNTPRVCV